MNLTSFHENDNRAGGKIFPQYIPESIPEQHNDPSRNSCASVAPDLATPCQRAIAQQRLRFELEFASEPDFNAIKRSLQALQQWGAAQ